MIGEVLSVTPGEVELFRDVTYEWEEEFSRYFDVPVHKIIIASHKWKNRIKSFINKIFPAVRTIFKRVKKPGLPVLTQDINLPLSVCFVMFPPELSMCSGYNSLPIFLDVWDNEDIDAIIRSTKKLKLYYVTSRDVYNRIKEKDSRNSVRYMPLSVADKYHSENFKAYRDKYIDVFMPGRGNPVLHEYMLRYAEEHREIKYVYRHIEENFECRSTDGSIVLYANDRAGYMDILASSRISLVGCSGVDNARQFTNGICFPTPRFYESAVLGCALIGRYPDNEEFRELNMNRYCPNITSYEQFVAELERALAQTPEELYAQNHEFIINSLTSKRAEQIRRDLEELTCRNS